MHIFVVFFVIWVQGSDEATSVLCIISEKVYQVDLIIFLCHDRNIFLSLWCMVFFHKNSMVYFYSCIVTPRKVNVIEEQSIKNKNGTTITWDPIKLNCSGISPEYFLNFTNKNVLIYRRNTTSNTVSCNSECENATSFIIWAVVDGGNWEKTWYNLTAISEGKIYLIFNLLIFSLSALPGFIWKKKICPDFSFCRLHDPPLLP